jgi:hypothetical protein
MARRSGTRYLNILRGKKGPSAKTKLLAYLNGDVDLEYPSRRGNRPVPVAVWVRPFVLPLAADVRLRQAATTGSDIAIGYVGAYVSKTNPGAENEIILARVLSPRAAITTGRDTSAGTPETSKISGLSYRKYGGKTYSIPFGEGTAAEDKNEDSVFLKIRSAVKAASASNLCSFVPGSYSV